MAFLQSVFFCDLLMTRLISEFCDKNSHSNLLSFTSSPSVSSFGLVCAILIKSKNLFKNEHKILSKIVIKTSFL